jgi:hypothetical protein
MREKEDLFVSKALGHFTGTNISKRNANIFRLPSAIASIQVGIPEKSPFVLAIPLLDHSAPHSKPRSGWKPLRAKEALATCDRKRNHNTVAARQVPNGRADFFNNAHEFMTHDQRFWLGHKAVVHVQVGSADRRRSNSQNNVPRIFELCILDALHPHILWFVVNNRFHTLQVERNAASLRPYSGAIQTR